MKIFLISVTMISSVLMVIVILLQQGKGAGLGAAFGRGAQGGLFTSSGKANFLTRTTSALVTIFLLSSLALSIFLGSTRQDGVFDELGQGSEAVEAIESLDSDSATTLETPTEEEIADDVPASVDSNAADDADTPTMEMTENTDEVMEAEESTSVGDDDAEKPQPSN